MRVATSARTCCTLWIVLALVACDVQPSASPEAVQQPAALPTIAPAATVKQLPSASMIIPFGATSTITVVIPTGITPPTSSASIAPNVLIQYEQQPGYYDFSQGSFYQWARVPRFTLYADGLLIYREGHQTLYDDNLIVVQLSPQEMQVLVQQILNLGWERIKDNPRTCGGVGNEVCVASSDELNMTLRDRIHGPLREITLRGVYGYNSTIFEAIWKFVSNYHHPGGQAYKPTNAAIVAVPIHWPNTYEAPVWPFDPTQFAPPQAERGAGVITGQPLATLLAMMPRNMGKVHVRSGCQGYDIELIPWLPNVDYTAAVTEAVQQGEFVALGPSTANPNITPTATPATCPTATPFPTGPSDLPPKNMPYPLPAASSQPSVAP